MTDPTLDTAATSWVDGTGRSDFPVQSMPYGVFRRDGGEPRVGVAIGDSIVDMAALHAVGFFEGTELPDDVFGAASLNPFLACGAATWAAVRLRLFDLLSAAKPPPSPEPGMYLVPRASAQMLLPIAPGDFVDFYSSLDHASNMGRIFRPDDPPLLPNWRRLPVGYHGRTSSIVVSGTGIRRPSGQRRSGDGEVAYGPTRRLDVELEVGFVTGPGNNLGEPIAVDEAENHIFGLCLVNDWSARDIQAWEYRPLGPFLAKSFATTISPWIVPLVALDPYRTPGPDQDPRPLRYLRREPNPGIDISLEIAINGATVSQTNFKHVYWTMAQQLAHVTANGANVRPGDLYSSGTVSGPNPGSFGSLLELSWNGERPVDVGGGETRSFLHDGDTVSLRGTCGGNGTTRLGFGDCSGTVLPAIS